MGAAPWMRLSETVRQSRTLNQGERSEKATAVQAGSLRPREAILTNRRASKRRNSGALDLDRYLPAHRHCVILLAQTLARDRCAAGMEVRLLDYTRLSATSAGTWLVPSGQPIGGTVRVDLVYDDV